MTKYQTIYHKKRNSTHILNYFFKYHLDIKQIAKTDADLKDVLFLGKTSGHIDKSFTITCAGDHTFLMFGFCFLFLKQYT